MKEKTITLKTKLSTEMDAASICDEKEVINDLAATIKTLQGVNEFTPLNVIHALCVRVVAGLEVLAVNVMTTEGAKGVSVEEFENFYKQASEFIEDIMVQYNLLDNNDEEEEEPVPQC